MMVAPELLMRRRAAMALRVVVWDRRRAAATRWRVLSARIVDLLCRLVWLVVERGDDPVEVPQDLLVHFGQAGVAFRVGGGDQLQDLLPVAAVLGQELVGGQEHRAGQAGGRASR